MEGEINREGDIRTPVPPSRSAPIIERAPLPIVEVQGSAHTVSHVNSAFCKLVGKPRSELIGRPFVEVVHGGNECVPILDRVCQTGEAVIHTREDDSEPEPAYWLYAMWPALDADEQPVGTIIQLTKAANFRQNAVAINEALLVSGLRQHELTEEAERLNAQLQGEIIERKKTEEALRLAKEMVDDQARHLERLVDERTAQLAAVNKHLQTFVYSIAHDLRGPLRAMQGFSVLLVKEAGAALSETGRDFAHRIKESAQFMDALLIDLLAFSSLSQEHIEPAPVNLEKVVTSVLSRFKNEIQEKNLQMEILGPWPTVLAHAPTLAQVLFNLISNAMKFSAPETRLWLRLRTEERGAFVRVWVEDNGIGIAPEHQDQVFQLFNRLHGDKYPGTGYGLAIVRKGLERMGGRVGLESTPGDGSRFWLELRKA
jgi:signal transduction histidine kinase